MSDLDYARHGLIEPRHRPEIPGGGPQTVAELLERGVAEHPHDPALIGRFRRYTFAELESAVACEAGALAGLGVEPGDRVGACLANHPDIIVLFLATARLGAIWVGINRALAPPEKAYILADAQVRVLFAETEVIDECRRQDLPDLRHLVAVDPVTFAQRHHRPEGLDALTQIESSTSPAAPFDPAAIAYTSGTTGFPKGVVHSHHNLLLPGAVTRLTRQYDATLVQGVCLPLTVLNLMVLGPCVTLQSGAPLVCMDRLDPLGVATWIREEQIATFSAVPTIVHGLLTHPDVKAEDLASLQRPGVGGADLPESFREIYRQRFGAEVTIGYGLTEAPTAVTMSDPDAPPIPNEAGSALAHVEILILDANDNRVAPGEIGEICVGPATTGELAGVYTPMLGYWNQPEPTARALRGGVLHTADLGYLDDDGHLFVKDRRSDLIIRGGANVYPAEVERILGADERVAACAVVGAPDERLGEVVVAFVQPASGVVVDDSMWRALEARCRGALAAYKVPQRWIGIDDFTRNAMGKIVKKDLRLRVREEPHHTDGRLTPRP